MSRNISRNLNGPYAQGVPNPYTTHVHPYPTRYHGGIYTRPVFGMPYVRSPHAVFKPDDFYEYYGVKGLGAFGQSSLGNGSVGRNTLGLGATGQPIYYLASSTNPKVTALQGGLNKVLIAQGYREIPVTGKLDYRTCAALGLMWGKYREEVLTQVDQEILNEAAATCNAAQKNSTVKSQVISYAKELETNRNPTPAKELVPQTEVVPATTAPAVKPPSPSAPAPVTTPPVSKPIPVFIEDPPGVMDVPEMTITAMPSEKTSTKSGAMLIGGLLLGAGALAYFNRKKLGF